MSEPSPVPPACLSAGRSDPARCCWSCGSTGCGTSSSAWPGGRRPRSRSPPASLLLKPDVSAVWKHKITGEKVTEGSAEQNPGWNNLPRSVENTRRLCCTWQRLYLAASMCEGVKLSVAEPTGSTDPPSVPSGETWGITGTQTEERTTITEPFLPDSEFPLEKAEVVELGLNNMKKKQHLLQYSEDHLLITYCGATKSLHRAELMFITLNCKVTEVATVILLIN